MRETLTSLFFIVRESEVEQKMADRFELVFRAVVDDASKQQILQEIQALEGKMKPLGVKIDVEQAVQGTEQIVKNYEHLEDGTKKITSESRKLSNEIGKYVVETYKAKKGSDDLVLSKTKEVNAIKLSNDQIHKQTIAQETLLNQIRKTTEINKAFIERGGLGQEYVDLEQAVKKLDPRTKDFNNLLSEQKLRFQQLGTEVSIVKKEVSDATRFTHVFGEQIGEIFKKFGLWLVVGNIFIGLFRQIREGISFLQELDKDLTEIAMITGITRDETRQLSLEYAKLGQEMAKTSIEISKVNTELVRQGLSLEVARERMEVILKLSAAARISTSDSVQIITSSVNAMGEGAEKTSDVLLKAGAVSASSAAQIGEAFTKTASSARATGMSIENLTAIISTLIEVTQESPSSLGKNMPPYMGTYKCKFLLINWGSPNVKTRMIHNKQECA